jgi:hypothetical protein
MSNIFIKGFTAINTENGLEIIEHQQVINEDVTEEKPETRGEKIRKELLNQFRKDVISEKRSGEQISSDGFTE